MEDVQNLVNDGDGAVAGGGGVILIDSCVARRYEGGLEEPIDLEAGHT